MCIFMLIRVVTEIENPQLLRGIKKSWIAKLPPPALLHTIYTTLKGGKSFSIHFTFSQNSSSLISGKRPSKRQAALLSVEQE